MSFTGIGSDGGFTVSFANEGKIADLELVWRNLKRDKLCQVASPAEMMKRLEQGHGRIVPIMGTDLRGARRLVIEKVTPFYLGEDGETAQEFVYPFAALECTLDGGSNRIVLKCPIIRQ